MLRASESKRKKTLLHECRRQFCGSVGSDGFEKVLIGPLGAGDAFLRGAKGRAAKNSVLASGAKHTRGEWHKTY
jgi:hypothetical protein